MRQSLQRLRATGGELRGLRRDRQWRLLRTRLSSVLIACIACVACGGATAIVPDDGSGGTSENGGATGVGGKPTGGVTGAGGKPTGGITGAGGKATGGVSTRWAKESNQSCNNDGDCAGVTEGPVCTCSSCYNAAINRNEYERWISAAGPPCGPVPCDPVGCEELVPTCFSGTCGVRPVDYIEPGQFDRTCSAQSDCYLVTVRDVCSAVCRSESGLAQCAAVY